MNPHAPFIIDIAGTVLSKVDRQRLQHPLVGGLILFARNWQSREQLADLCASIKRLRADLLICETMKEDAFSASKPMGLLTCHRCAF